MFHKRKVRINYFRLNQQENNEKSKEIKHKKK